jgi:hypothetical protein
MKVAINFTAYVEVANLAEGTKAAQDIDAALKNPMLKMFLLQKGLKVVGHTVDPNVTIAKKYG